MSANISVTNQWGKTKEQAKGLIMFKASPSRKKHERQSILSTAKKEALALAQYGSPKSVVCDQRTKSHLNGCGRQLWEWLHLYWQLHQN